MASSIDDLRILLLLLAEARDNHLWVTLPRARGKIREIGFRLFRVADDRNAYLVVWVLALRADGTDVCWSVSLRTADASFVIEGAVEVGDEMGNTKEVFSLSATTSDAKTAAAHIGAFVSDVCSQRQWEPRARPNEFH